MKRKTPVLWVTTQKLRGNKMASTDILDVLKRKINELEKIADEVEHLGKELFQKAPIKEEVERPTSYSRVAPPPEPHSSYHWGALDDELRNLQREAIRKYQRFYSSAHQFVKEYLPERENEFVENYQDEHYWGVLEYLQLHNTPYKNDRLSIIHGFEKKFEIQRSILLSIIDVAEVKELTLRKVISADLAKTEIEQAEALCDNGFHRAAGVIAGVALELHLKTLCDIKGIVYGPKATIDPVATELYKAKILDVTELNKMKYLASIRNKCAHGDPVSEKDIKSLIEDVRKLV